MDYDIFEKRAMWTFKECSWHKKMSEVKYIAKYGNLAMYPVLPDWMTERINKIRKLEGIVA